MEGKNDVAENKTEESRDNTVQVDSFVWAKMRGFPHWPGKVVKEEFKSERNEDGKKARVFWVYFYGSHDHSWIEEKYVCLYDEGKDLYGELDPAKNKKVTPRRKKEFEIGIEELEFSLKKAPLQADLDLLQKRRKIRKTDGRVVLGILGSGSLYFEVLWRCAESLRRHVPDWDVSKVITLRKMSSKVMNSGIKKDLLTYEEDASEIIKKSDVIVSCYSDVDSLQASNIFQELSKGMMAFKIYIEMTPMDIKTEDENSRAIKGLCGTYIGAPVLCPGTFTKEDKIAVLVSGEHAGAQITNISRFINIFASPITILGGNECHNAATKTSLIFHMMMGSVIASVAESLSLAEKVALDQSLLMDVFRMTIDFPLIRSEGCALLTSDEDLVAIETCMKYALSMGSESLEDLPVSYAANLMLSQTRKKKGNGKQTVPERNKRYKITLEKPSTNSENAGSISIHAGQCNESDGKTLETFPEENASYKSDSEKSVAKLQDEIPAGENSVSASTGQNNESDGQRSDKQEIFPERNSRYEPEKPLVDVQDEILIEESSVSVDASHKGELASETNHKQDTEVPLVDPQGEELAQEGSISINASQSNESDGQRSDKQEIFPKRNSRYELEKPLVDVQDEILIERSSVSVDASHKGESSSETNHKQDTEVPLVDPQDEELAQGSSISINTSQCNESEGKGLDVKNTIPERNLTQCSKKSSTSESSHQCNESGEKTPGRKEIVPQRNTKRKRSLENVDLQNDPEPDRESSISIDTSQCNESDRKGLDAQNTIPKRNLRQRSQKSSISENSNQRESDGKPPGRKVVVSQRNTKRKRGLEKSPVDLQDDPQPCFSESSAFTEASQSSDSDQSNSGFVFFSRSPTDAAKVRKKPRSRK